MDKIKVWVAQDIQGTYFVWGTYNLDADPDSPYTRNEERFKHELDHIFPHLTLKKMKIKIKSLARKYGFTPIIIAETTTP